MKAQIKGRVLEVNQGEGSVYVTMNDTEVGGSIKLAFPGNQEIRIDSLLNIDADIKPGIGKYGQYLKVLKLNNQGKEA